jgi:hypothetical protein
VARRRRAGLDAAHIRQLAGATAGAIGRSERRQDHCLSHHRPSSRAIVIPPSSQYGVPPVQAPHRLRIRSNAGRALYALTAACWAASCGEAPCTDNRFHSRSGIVRLPRALLSLWLAPIRRSASRGLHAIELARNLIRHSYRKSRAPFQLSLRSPLGASQIDASRGWLKSPILEPASSAVPAGTENEQHDDDDDQQRRVVHAESSFGKRERASSRQG